MIAVPIPACPPWPVPPKSSCSFVSSRKREQPQEESGPGTCSSGVGILMSRELCTGTVEVIGCCGLKVRVCKILRPECLPCKHYLGPIWKQIDRWSSNCVLASRLGALFSHKCFLIKFGLSAYTELTMATQWPLFHGNRRNGWMYPKKKKKKKNATQCKHKTSGFSCSTAVQPGKGVEHSWLATAQASFQPMRCSQCTVLTFPFYTLV